MPKNILITGGGTGNGAALARAYAEPGRTIFLCGRREAPLVEIADACNRHGATTTYQCLDVTDSAAMAAWIGTADARNPLDLVIASAGILTGRQADGTAESRDQAAAVIDTNVLGVINTVSPAIAAMKQRGHGQVALLSSLVAYRGFAAMPAYSASKAAIRAYGEALRSAHRQDGICVSVIAPGFVESPMEGQIHGPKGLRLTADQAARRIVRGLARNRAYIAFPLTARLGLHVLQLLPFDQGDRFINAGQYFITDRDAN